MNFIVRAVDDILKESFGISEGLADNRRVTVLDFACGTGTFLVEVFQRIFENIGGPDSSRADLVVRGHLLENIFGFEYLIAPYTIAHLKLSQYLSDQGHALKGAERLQVFLTNTLEPIEPQRNLLLPAISAEVQAAQKVKEREILVITGNPPYSGISKNMGSAAQQLIEKYKYIDGKHFGEKKHWLHDDYVKFIAFAQKKMNEMQDGVVGIISNHSWLDNPTFRGMRRSLMLSFQTVFVIDLHGNAKKKEESPDGSKDENVFDIEQGVAISLFVKNKNSVPGVFHAELWGSRQSKYVATARGTLASYPWRKLEPDSPNWLFIPQSGIGRATYSSFTSITNIFNNFVTGIVTARDRLVVGFSRKELKT